MFKRRNFLKSACVTGALALFAAAYPTVGQQQAGEADVVYHNGLVYTVDAVRSRAQAFAVRDGKFLAVGSNDDMKAVTGPDTKVVGLKGKMEKEDETGTIEPGKSADFIVINQNILDIPVENIHKTKVLKTVLQGHTVYEAK